MIPVCISQSVSNESGGPQMVQWVSMFAMKAGELNLILCIPHEGKRKPTPMLPSNLLPLQLFNAFVKLRNNTIFSSCSCSIYCVLISVRCFSCIYWCDWCWTFHSVMIALPVSRGGNRASSMKPSTLVLNYRPLWACLNSYCLPRINPSSYDIWCLLYPSRFVLKCFIEDILRT